MRTLGWSWLALWLALLAPLAADAAPVEGRDYQVAKPGETWSAPRNPVVLVIVDRPATLEATLADYTPLASSRGALLVAAYSGQDLAALLGAVGETYPISQSAVVAVAREATADGAWRKLVEIPGRIAGFVLIDAPLTATSQPLRGALPVLQQHAILIATGDAPEQAAKELGETLRGFGVAYAVRRAPPPELPVFIGAALTTLLPPCPARDRLYDPATHCHLQALPGWEFVRHDSFFALLRPKNAARGPVIEVATGALGERSFEDYVNATLTSLQVPGITLVRQQRLTPEEAPRLAHEYLFTDARSGREMMVYWIQVGRGGDLVSFRALATKGALTPHFDALRELAMSARFEDPPR